jgi:hypothetical protein
VINVLYFIRTRRDIREERKERLEERNERLEERNERLEERNERLEEEEGEEPASVLSKDMSYHAAGPGNTFRKDPYTGAPRYFSYM